MLQNVIVYIIGVLLLAYIVWRVVRIVRGREPLDVCSGCKGCEQREIFLGKQNECRQKGGGTGCPSCGSKSGK